MQVVLWDGNAHHTRLFPIHSGEEWALLTEDIKTSIRSTKRLHPPGLDPPCLVMAVHDSSFIPFVLDSVSREELADVDEQEAELEGFSSLSAWKQFWMTKEKSGFFRPYDRVWAYKLHRFDMSRFESLNRDPDFLAAMKIVGHLYPDGLE